MPKLKTNRAAMKRFTKTGTGKIKRYKCGKAHILTKKTAKMKRRLRKPGTVCSALMRQTRKMLPYL